jgi:hypothetical protein
MMGSVCYRKACEFLTKVLDEVEIGKLFGRDLYALMPEA